MSGRDLWIEFQGATEFGFRFAQLRLRSENFAPEDVSFRGFRLGLEHFFKDLARLVEASGARQRGSERHQDSRVGGTAKAGVFKQRQRFFVLFGSCQSQTQVFLKLVTRWVARRGMFEGWKRFRIVLSAEQREAEIEVSIEKVRLEFLN